ncbi:HAD family hydrolase [Streptomyces sp. NPDC048392]|uniref:HAD family hydrolase n=1 Tax=Streptomyces sp. NPDC048392 TaxID=3365543 RepID=UPI00371B9870
MKGIEEQQTLILWDIDRTLLYVGDIDRQVYRETFAEVVGRPAVRLPARGTGVTMPLAIRSLLLDNGVPEETVPELLPRMVELLPKRLAAHTGDLRSQGVLMPGAEAALQAVHEQEHWVPTVVTGNLRSNALLKLTAFNLDGYLDADIGGFASDDDHRPALVGIAQKRAQAKYETVFTHANTVIIGDSLEDVRTGLEGGVSVIGVTSGKTTGNELAAAGADIILDSLEDISKLRTSIERLTVQSG